LPSISTTCGLLKLPLSDASRTFLQYHAPMFRRHDVSPNQFTHAAIPQSPDLQNREQCLQTKF
jgi:hypothetical protein